MATLKYTIKSVIKALSLIIALSILTFTLAQLFLIDPVRAYVGAESIASPEQMEYIAQKWGLNDPPLERYGKWATSMLKGDMGDSIVYSRPVIDVIAENVKNSFWLMFVSWLF